MFSPWRRVLQYNVSWSYKYLHATSVPRRAVVINGSDIADQILGELKKDIDAWVQSGQKAPKLVALLVGEDAASKTYVGRKMKAAKSIGIDSHTVHLAPDITERTLIERIETLNVDPYVDGILVQLPLPKSINEKLICQTIDPSKDVDGFHLKNLGSLTLDSKGIVPATALAVRELITRTNIETLGKNAVVVGRSKHVGLPIALLLHSDGKGETGALDMTTTICHRYTPHTSLEKFTKLADVIVVAAGVPGLITKEMIKPGCCIIDVGITRVKTADGKYRLVGDVDYDSVKEIAGYITPVPGGVGPMTVAMLMKNTFNAAVNNQSNKS